MKLILTLVALLLMTALQGQTSGVRGSMLQMDGINDYVNIGNLGGTFMTTTTQITLETWIKLDTVENRTISFIEQMGGSSTSVVALETGSGPNTGKFSLFVGGAYYGRSNVGVVVADQWLHCAMVYDGSKSTNAERLKLYVNGIEEPLTYGGAGGAPIPSSFTLDNAPFLLGSERGVGQNPPVAMDEVRIWSVARTLNQIRDNMHLTLSGNETGLVAYYQFNDDDVAGVTGGVKDASGNNYHGTTVNMDSMDYVESTVAVAAGVSERINVTANGSVVFNNVNMTIDFASSPNGEVMVSRLSQESPHGANNIGYDVDNEYFVVYNFGATNNATINGVTMQGIDQLNGTTLPSEIHLYHRGARAYGNTWQTPLDTAASFIASPTGQVVFSNPRRLVSGGQFVVAQTGNSTIPVQRLAAEVIEIELFPNPAAQYVQVRWKQPNTTTTTIVVFNAKGQVMHQSKTNDSLVMLDIEEWLPGLYTVALFEEHGRLVAQKRMIRQ